VASPAPARHPSTRPLRHGQAPRRAVPARRRPGLGASVRDALLDLQQQVRNQLHALDQLPEVIETVRQRFEQLLTTFATQLATVEAEILEV
jgi:hypothetical protein